MQIFGNVSVSYKTIVSPGASAAVDGVHYTGVARNVILNSNANTMHVCVYVILCILKRLDSTLEGDFYIYIYIKYNDHTMYTMLYICVCIYIYYNDTILCYVCVCMSDTHMPMYT